MNDYELQQLLSQLRDQPVPFESVRERVLERAHREPVRRFVPLWAGAFAAAALLILTFALRPALKLDSMPPAKPASIAVPAFALNVAAPRPAPASQAAKVQRRHSRPVEKSEEFTMKLLTDDPNVVIYWIVGGQGD